MSTRSGLGFPPGSDYTPPPKPTLGKLPAKTAGQWFMEQYGAQYSWIQAVRPFNSVKRGDYLVVDIDDSISILDAEWALPDQYFGYNVRIYVPGHIPAKTNEEVPQRLYHFT